MMRFEGAASRAGFSTICVSENSLLPPSPACSPTPITPYMWMRSAAICSTAMMFAFPPRLLAGEARRARARQVARQGLEIGAALALGQGVLELELAVEMVLDHALVAAGDEDEML